MAIAVTPTPVTGNAALTSTDLAAIITALTPVITLPTGKTWSEVSALNITVQTSGAAVLNIRFAS